MGVLSNYLDKKRKIEVAEKKVRNWKKQGLSESEIERMQREEYLGSGLIN